MSRTIALALATSSLALVLAAPQAQAERPEDLPPGSILSIFVGGSGIAGPTQDRTTFFHRGDWERDSTFSGPCSGETTKEQRRSLRDIKMLIRPYAQENAFFPSTGADLQVFELSTVHGTVTWVSGAELPADLAVAADLVFAIRLEATDSDCFGRN